MSISPRPSGPLRLRGRSQSRLYFFLAVFALFFSCSCPDSEVLDVLDDSSEGLPVSLVKHGFVDGWKASMIILTHLVDVNGSFVGQTELVFSICRER